MHATSIATYSSGYPSLCKPPPLPHTHITDMLNIYRRILEKFNSEIQFTILFLLFSLDCRHNRRHRRRGTPSTNIHDYQTLLLLLNFRLLIALWISRNLFRVISFVRQPGKHNPAGMFPSRASTCKLWSGIFQFSLLLGPMMVDVWN